MREIEARVSVTDQSISPSQVFRVPQLKSIIYLTNYLVRYSGTFPTWNLDFKQTADQLWAPAVPLRLRHGVLLCHLAPCYAVDERPVYVCLMKHTPIASIKATDMLQHSTHEYDFSPYLDYLVPSIKLNASRKQARLVTSRSGRPNCRGSHKLMSNRSSY